MSQSFTKQLELCVMLRLTIVFIVTGHAGRCVNSYTLITGRDTVDLTFVATPHDLLCFLSSLFWSGWHQTFDSVQFKRDRLTHHVSHFYLAWIVMTSVCGYRCAYSWLSLYVMWKRASQLMLVWQLLPELWR